MNRKQKLLKKLAALADELDLIGETALVDQIVLAMQVAAFDESDAEFIRSSPAAAQMKAEKESGPFRNIKPGDAVSPKSPDKVTDTHVLPEAKVMGDRGAVSGKKKIRQLNAKVQGYLNDLLSRRGEDPVRGDGIFDDRGQKALREFAGEYGKDYTNWKSLFANLDEASAAYKGNEKGSAGAISTEELASSSPYSNDPHGLKGPPVEPRDMGRPTSQYRGEAPSTKF